MPPRAASASHAGMSVSAAVQDIAMSAHSSPAASTARTAITLPKLREMRARGEKIAMLTCYDATFAQVLDEAGVDTLLVGDSLGNVLQGRTSTLPVMLADIDRKSTRLNSSHI